MPLSRTCGTETAAFSAAIRVFSDMCWLLCALRTGGEGPFHEIADALLGPDQKGTTFAQPRDEIGVSSGHAPERRLRDPTAMDVILNLSDEFGMIAHEADDLVIRHTTSSTRCDVSHLFDRKPVVG